MKFGKKQKIGILAIIVVVAIILAYYGGLLGIYVTKENFNSYTEYDPYSPEVLVKTGDNLVTQTNMQRLQGPYLTKDFGANNAIFDGDFEIYYHLKMTASQPCVVGGAIVLANNANVHTIYQSSQYSDGLVFYMFRYDAYYEIVPRPEVNNPADDLHRYIIYDRNNQVDPVQSRYMDYSPNAETNMNTDMWFTVTRVGRTFTMITYADEARTQQLWTDTYTYNAAEPLYNYRYITIAPGYGYSDSNGTKTMTQIISDVYFQEPAGAPPTAAFTWSPTSPYVNDPVVFDASTSTGTINLYEWDWDNDGTYDESATSSSATHTFTSSGTKTVVLRVTDTYAQTDTESHTITVVPLPGAPSVTTSAATSITTTGATLNVFHYHTGGSACTVWFEYGQSTSYGFTTSPVSASVGAFNAAVTGLSPSTLYHFRAVANNAYGNDYGDDLQFTTSTQILAPTVETRAASGIYTTTATLNGELLSTGGANCNVYFEYGLTTAYGATTTQVPLSSPQTFSRTINSLTSSTTYHFRAVATNSVGPDYGDDFTFTTSAGTSLPDVSTEVATNIGQTSATLNGNLISLGGTTTCNVWFQYGPTTSYGYATPPQSVSATGTYSYTISGLTANTPYYFRACAQNSVGPDYGSQMTFTTIGGTSYQLTVNTWSNTNVIIPGATVTVNPGAFTATSNSNGVATINLPANTYQATVTATGYQPWTSPSFTMSGAYTITSQNIPTTTMYTLTVYTKSNTNVVIQGASVSVGGQTQTSNSNGEASFSLAGGSYTVVVTATGYNPWSLGFTLSGTYSITSQNVPIGSTIPVKCWRCYDKDGDGEKEPDYYWFNYTTQTTCGYGPAAGYPYSLEPTDCTTPPQPTPGFELIGAIGAIAVALILLRRRSKKQ